jgi:hypothetical protein
MKAFSVCDSLLEVRLTRLLSLKARFQRSFITYSAGNQLVCLILLSFMLQGCKLVPLSVIENELYKLLCMYLATL